MNDVLYNKSGEPLAFFGKTYMATTTGSPEEKRPKVSEQVQKVDGKSMVGSHEYVYWGDGNDFPSKSHDIIRSVGVLNTGLRYIRNYTLGQGIFPVNVVGYDDNGNEVLKVLEDTKLINFLKSRMVRRYMEKAGRDYFKYGGANAQMLPNSDGSSLVGINTLNAINCRYTVANKGVIENLIYSGKFPYSPGDDYEVYSVLDDYDPLADLKRRKLANQIKGANLIYAVKDSWSNNDYYSDPIWLSAYLAGWVDIAMVVPKFLKRAFENQISWKWHVQIPYAFWDKKFPKEDYKTTDERTAAIENFMDTIEESLCKPENANKAIFTMFEIGVNGKTEEQWIIKALENKLGGEQNLVTSAAANSEMCFALMVNPNVLGAGMPGGAYAGNQGGSNLREAFLVNIANAWIDRQNLMDPLEAFLEFNGVKDVELRFRNTILTTLDTGAGTKKTLS